MFRYAEAVAGRGLRVIIAGAGGAAHLPGMVAAKTDLPVIGVPVESHALRAAARVSAYGDAVLTGKLTERSEQIASVSEQRCCYALDRILGGEQLGRMLKPCGWVTAWSSSNRSRTQRRVKSATSKSSPTTTICASSASSARAQQ